MRGKNLRFAGYGGVELDRQAIGAMFVSGAIAGLVGAIVVLGSQFRFIDGALLTPAYTWSGLMAALLVGGEPVGAIARRPLLRRAADRRLRHAARDFGAARADARPAGDRHPLPRDAARRRAARPMSGLFTPFLFQSAVQAITPILLASLAGVLCGRVGVFNLALEGQMLVGAFAAVVGSYFAHSALGGVAAAIAGAAVFSLIARLWRDHVSRRSGRHRHRHESARLGAHRLPPARRLRRQRHLQRSGHRRPRPDRHSAADRRARPRLGLRPAVGADLGRLGADGARQHCGVHDPDRA